MEYLPRKLGDFVRANVGVHIPAPWSIWVVRFLLLNFPIFVAEQFIDWGPYKRLDIFGFL
jgi:hypothetical protein